MKGAMIRCVRCKGRKKVFKVGGAYSYTDTGGEKVDCPMCLGSGEVKSLAQAIEDGKLKQDPCEELGVDDAKKERPKAKAKGK